MILSNKNKEKKKKIIPSKQLQFQVTILNTNSLHTYGIKYSYLTQIIFKQGPI